MRRYTECIKNGKSWGFCAPKRIADLWSPTTKKKNIAFVTAKRSRIRHSLTRYGSLGMSSQHLDAKNGECLQCSIENVPLSDLDVQSLIAMCNWHWIKWSRHIERQSINSPANGNIVQSNNFWITASLQHSIRHVERGTFKLCLKYVMERYIPGLHLMVKWPRLTLRTSCNACTPWVHRMRAFSHNSIITLRRDVCRVSLKRFIPTTPPRRTVTADGIVSYRR